ncbi:flagellar assembly protein FliH [Hafnia alvei FB1]|uniref:Flagellar assembly protein FliH n=1 Tax=Hafnia alvei FB1 TaxID=1453496 RepID=A0A097R3K4_HAFAL|nr:flagellar assembly protein FliH [Hafnia alvei]AIU73311.1 flagellar assembly protein FliH [Hafnia alvei FB1]TBL59760.1 flagellar assembly protein FliH [Hafnia alvei]
MSNPPNPKDGFRKAVFPKATIEETNQQWQRWEMRDFSAPRKPKIPAFKMDPLPPAAESPPAAIAQAELEQLRENAQMQGYQHGLQQGEKQGYDAGFQQGLNEGRSQGLQQAQTEQQPVLDHWRQLAQEFQHSLQAMDNVIAARLMQMALTAAKQIIGQSPVCDASAVLQQIQHLINQEPLFNGNLQLRVNPQDLPIIQQQLGVQLEQQGWRLLADTQLHRGGCKISAEGGELDASIATRWQELCKLAAPELPL